MTLEEAIKRIDAVKPNGFTNESKTEWINECEGLVQTEALLFAPEEIVRYKYEADRTTELLVRPPHDKLYTAYLAAMIDFANGEYDRYLNTMTMFNTHWAEFLRYLTTHWRPADAYKEGLI